MTKNELKEKNLYPEKIISTRKIERRKLKNQFETNKIKNQWKIFQLKLDDEKITKIKNELGGKKTFREIANILNVNKNTIFKINKLKKEKII